MSTFTRTDYLNKKYPNSSIWFDGTGRVYVAGNLIGRFSLGFWSKPHDR